MKISKILIVMVVLAFFVNVLSGCGKRVATDTGNTSSLTWYYIGPSNEDEAIVKEIYDAANKIIKKKIDVNINFQPISVGEYTKKMQLKVSASEEFDICLTGTNFFPYFDNIKKGAFVPLDDLLDKYGSKIKKLIPEKIWQATKVDNKIYAVPNYQASFSNIALVFKKDLVDKYNLKDKIYAIKTVYDLTEILDVIKKNEPNIVPTGYQPKVSLDKIEGYLEKPISNIPIGVDKDLNVIDLTKGEPREKELALEKLSREWFLKGFFHPDSGLKFDMEGQIKEGKFFLVSAVALPGAEADLEKRWGYPVYCVAPGDPILSTNSIAATMTAISRTSKNHQKAIEFIELINDDKDLYNLLCFGIEGKQYTKTGEDRIEVSSNAKYSAYAWALGCQFNAFKLPGQPDNVWEESKRLNEEAYTAPLLGCYIDIGNIKTEIANIRTAYEPYRSVLNGHSDDYAQVHKQLDEQTAKDLGLVQAEIIKQVEEYKKTKGR